jgi:hypothetical protein
VLLHNANGRLTEDNIFETHSSRNKVYARSENITVLLDVVSCSLLNPQGLNLLFYIPPFAPALRVAYPPSLPPMRWLTGNGSANVK